MYKLTGIITRIIYNHILNPEYDNLVRYLDSEQFYYKYKNEPRKYNRFNSVGLYNFFKNYNRLDHNEELWAMNKRVKWTTGYKGDDVAKYKAFNCFRFNDNGNNDSYTLEKYKSILTDYISPESHTDVCTHKYSSFGIAHYNRFEYCPSYRKITAKEFKDELMHFTADGD